MVVGVLAIQGSFIEHITSLKKMGLEVHEIRHVEDLKNISALILPGGESTTMSKLMKEYSLDKEIIKLAKKGLPIYGTCAGLILLAKNISYGLRLMDVEVDRNAYGRQLDSFETEINFDNKKIPAVFIRAPKIIKVGKDVEIIAKYEEKAVFVRQGNLFASSFHPELSNDLTVYENIFNISQG